MPVFWALIHYYFLHPRGIVPVLHVAHTGQTTSPKHRTDTEWALLPHCVPSPTPPPCHPFLRFENSKAGGWEWYCPVSEQQLGKRLPGGLGVLHNEAFLRPFIHSFTHTFEKPHRPSPRSRACTVAVIAPEGQLFGEWALKKCLGGNCG